MLPIEQYPDTIAQAKLKVLESSKACEAIQAQLESIYVPAKYAAYVGSDFKSESQRAAALEMNLLRNPQYQALKGQESILNCQYQEAKIDLEKLQDEFLLLKLKLRAECVWET